MRGYLKHQTQPRSIFVGYSFETEKKNCYAQIGNFKTETASEINDYENVTENINKIKEKYVYSIGTVHMGGGGGGLQNHIL